MTDELKEGDEVVLRGRVDAFNANGYHVALKVGDGDADYYEVPAEYLRKVRPGTYEVTARDVAKMICRIMRLNFWNYRLWAEQSVLLPSYFNPLRRWVHCRLRELRRKRGGR